MDVFGRILKQTDKLLEKVNKELYLTHSGIKANSDLTPIYQNYKALGCIPSIRFVKTILSNCCGFKRKNLRYLYEFILDNYLANKTKEVSDQISNIQATTMVNIEGKDVPFRSAEALLFQETDRKKRNQIDEARKKAVTSMNPMMEKQLATSYSCAKKTGFDGYISLYSKSSGMDLYQLLNQTEQLLTSTEDIFQTHLASELEKKINVSISEASNVDVSSLFKFNDLNQFFPQDLMINVAKATTDQLGIDILANGNITLDIEARPLKSPRAFCATIQIPEEIMLVINPQGGLTDWLAFFHELGHSLHYGYTDINQEMEFKRLGDYSLTESYAFLFEHLLLNRSWLEEHLKIKDIDSFLKSIHLWKLYMLRRYSSKLSYELQLHKSSETDDNFDKEFYSKEYARILSKGCGVKYSPEYYLYDLDPAFYSARYLRAWYFESNLANHMNVTFGTDWFKSKKAGEFLKDLWKTGQEKELSDLGNELGFDPFDDKNLLSEFDKYLR